ncbi:MAG: RNA chaperone Hfq [Burkholderiaceae bacterium]
MSQSKMHEPLGDAEPMPENSQFTGLNRLRRERTWVDVYLIAGTRLQGRIRSFDSRMMLLQTEHGDIALYHHAVSSVQRSKTRAKGAAARAIAAGRHDPRPLERSLERRGGPRSLDGDGEAAERPRLGVPRPRPNTEAVVVTRRRSRLAAKPDG